MEPHLTLFAGKTTYKDDYTLQKVSGVPQWTQFNSPVPKQERIYISEPYTPVFTPTLGAIKAPLTDFPFTTTWRTRPIIEEYSGTKTFGDSTKCEDPLHDGIVKNRRRITSYGPSMCLDDVEPDKRKLMVAYLYQSETQRFLKTGGLPIPKKQLPNTTREITDPVYNNYKHFDPTHDDVPFSKDLYWPKRNLVSSKPGENPLKCLVPEEEREEIRDLIDKDQLRNFYDIVNPYYTGYRPKMVYGRLNKLKINDNIFL